MKPKHPKAAKFVRSKFFERVRDFDHLEKKIASLPEVERGDAFEVFVESWLNVVRKEKKVLPSDSILPSMQRKLGLPASKKEVGWDGVFTAMSNVEVVYQVKYRTGKKQLSWTELATFFASTERSPHRCVITNINGVTNIAANRKRYFVIAKNEFRTLKKANFRAIATWLNGAKPKEVKRTPRPYQRKAIREVQAGFEREDRTHAVMACGTGKTLVTLWVHEALKAKRTLVLLPSLALVRQTFKEWSLNSDLKNTLYICVCSEVGITKGIDDLSFRLSDLEFPVTTNAKELRALIAKNKSKKIVVFSTYHSSSVVGSATKRGTVFDFGVFDEAHKTVGKKKTNFTYALTDKNIRIKKRLFVTATPRTINIRKKDRHGEFDVSSMDDSAIYGNRSHELLFSESVKRNIICDYRLIISVVTKADVDRVLLKKGDVRIKRDLVRAMQVAHQLALKNAVQRFKLKNLFTFHGSIKAAQSFVSGGPEGIQSHLKNLDCYHVNGAMTSALREATLYEFDQSPRALISNARCLTEGVNLPSVDCVSFIDPRKSKVDIVQAAGRAMRKAGPTKSYGYIFVPLYVEQKRGESVDEAVERSDYGQIVDVLNALREHDNDLNEVITAMGIAKGEGVKGTIRARTFGGKVKVIGPSVSVKKLEKSINTKIADKLIVSWDKMYGLLKSYVKKNVTANVPQLEEYKGNKLGAWVTRNRTDYNKGRLSRNRYDKLVSLKGWVWDTREAAWQEGYSCLIDYLKKFPDVDGVRVRGLHLGYRLGQWVTVQRIAYKGGGSFKITEERIKLLEETRGWDWDPRASATNRMFEKLEEYYEENSTSEVPSAYKTKDGAGLGIWCEGMRYDYRKGKLSSEIIDRLESFDYWAWDPLDAGFQLRFKILQELAYNGRGLENMPGTLIIDGINIGVTVRDYRNKKRVYEKELSNNKKLKYSKKHKNRLEQYALLESLPGWSWDPHADQWKMMFNKLQDYLKYNDGKYPSGSEEDKNTDIKSILTWITKQRSEYKTLDNNGEKKLADDKIKKLESLQNWIWDKKQVEFFRKLSLLENYRDEKGNYHVPRKYVIDGTNLGQFCIGLKGVILNDDTTYTQLDLKRLKHLKRFVKEVANKPFSHYTKKF